MHKLITRTKHQEDDIRNIIYILATCRRSLTLTQLKRRLIGTTHLTHQELHDIVFENPDHFFVHVKDEDVIVVHITKISLCQRQTLNDRDDFPFCNRLHMCLPSLSDERCQCCSSLDHDLRSNHNITVLKNHLLDDIPVDDLKYLLRRMEIRVNVCDSYNMGKRCIQNENSECRNLHVCREYIQGTCNNVHCPWNHDIQHPGLKFVLAEDGVDTSRPPNDILIDLGIAMSKNSTDRQDSGIGELCTLQESKPGLLPPPVPFIDQSSMWVYGHPNASMYPVRPYHLTPQFCPPNSMQLYHGIQNSIYHRNQLAAFYGIQNAYQGQNDGIAPYAFLNYLPNIPCSWKPAQFSYGKIPPRFRKKSQLAHKALCQPDQTVQEGHDENTSTSDEYWSGVCLLHLHGRCSLGDKCFNFHGELPYQWMYKARYEDDWQVLPMEINIEIEELYCDPTNTEYFMEIGEESVKIIFKTMMAKSLSDQKYIVHRFSTASSVRVDDPFAPEWNWFLKTSDCFWLQYGQENGRGCLTNTTSYSVEMFFCANHGTDFMIYDWKNRCLMIDFSKMVQRNLHDNTEQDVCRRPTYISKEMFEWKKEIDTSCLKVPDYWEASAIEDITNHFFVVKVSNIHKATEYYTIERMFFKTMSRAAKIESIERIQNGDLFVLYRNKRSRMLKKSKNIEEKRLFHGTKTANYESICKLGFDFRLSGRSSGTKYGEGSYFATTARYLDSYTSSTGTKIMFVARVLVGDYVEGHHTFVRPPSKDESDPSSDLYDSCVNDINEPTIFVIFDNCGQVYPEYVIKYRCE